MFPLNRSSKTVAGAVIRELKPCFFAALIIRYSINPSRKRKGKIRTNAKFKIRAISIHLPFENTPKFAYERRWNKFDIYASVMQNFLLVKMNYFGGVGQHNKTEWLTQLLLKHFRFLMKAVAISKSPRLPSDVSCPFFSSISFYQKRPKNKTQSFWKAHSFPPKKSTTNNSGIYCLKQKIRRFGWTYQENLLKNVSCTCISLFILYLGNIWFPSKALSNLAAL